MMPYFWVAAQVGDLKDGEVAGVGRWLYYLGVDGGVVHQPRHVKQDPSRVRHSRAGQHARQVRPRGIRHNQNLVRGHRETW